MGNIIRWRQAYNISQIFHQNGLHFIVMQKCMISRAIISFLFLKKGCHIILFAKSTLKNFKTYLTDESLLPIIKKLFAKLISLVNQIDVIVY